MKLILSMLLLLASVSNVSAQNIPTSQNVVVVIEENHRYQDVLAQMPWLVKLGTQYAHTTNYRADASGSLIDYMWLASGSGEGCSGSSCPHTVTSDNIFRELDKAGKSWKVYAEDLPSVGFMGTSSGAYVKRHNPAPWYSDIINNKADQQKIVPFSQFAADLKSGLPNFAMVIPNLNNDAHNGSMTQADKWLQTNLEPLLALPAFQPPGGSGLLIIVFDECDAAAGGVCGGQKELIYTVLAGPTVKPSSVSNVAYKHENLLRTVMQAEGLKTFPGAAASVQPMADLFGSGIFLFPPPPPSTPVPPVTPPNPTPIIVPEPPEPMPVPNPVTTLEINPANHATVTNPFEFVVNIPDSVRGQLWVDHKKVVTWKGHAFARMLTLKHGSRRFVVNSFDSSGSLTKTVEYITVK